MSEQPPFRLGFIGAGLIMTAILLLSPLHHFGLYLGKLKTALAESRSMYLGSVRSFTKRKRQLVPSWLIQSLAAEDGVALGKGEYKQRHGNISEVEKKGRGEKR